MVASQGLFVGVAEFLYYNTGTYNSPTWSAIPIAKDVELPLSQSKAEIKARSSLFKMTLPAIKECPLNFDVIYDTSQPTLDIFKNAFMNNTVMDMAMSDQAIATNGAEYFRASYYVYEFPVTQKLEEGEAASVKMDLAYPTAAAPNTPAWVVVGS